MIRKKILKRQNKKLKKHKKEYKILINKQKKKIKNRKNKSIEKEKL